MNASATFNKDFTFPSTRCDEVLLVRVGRKRDHAAFAEFYTRHQVVFYNLAYRITKDRHLAEDVVQEGMDRIWKAASHFCPEGNARAWTQRIIIRESLKALRREQLKKIKLEGYARDCDAEACATRAPVLSLDVHPLDLLSLEFHPVEIIHMLHTDFANDYIRVGSPLGPGVYRTCDLGIRP